MTTPGELKVQVDALDRRVDTALLNRRREVDEMHANLEALRADHVSAETFRILIARIESLEQWRSNVMGRFIAVSVIGTICVALLTTLATNAVRALFG